MQKKIPFALPLICWVFLQWVPFFFYLLACFLAGFIVFLILKLLLVSLQHELIDLGLQYTDFCTQTKHSGCIMARYTYTTEVQCFCYILPTWQEFLLVFSYRLWTVSIWME